MSTIIEDMFARKTFNSRGEETIEVDIITTSGFGRASAPSGKSRGRAEVMPYPKGGVDNALKQIEELIIPEIVGSNALFQEEIDHLLHEIDGSKDLRVVGGNTAFAISLANCNAAANSYGLLLFQYLGGQIAHELPFPLGNTISGGRHADGKAPDIQEFLVLPYGASSFFEAATLNAQIHRRVGKILKKKHTLFSGGKSDEGAWVANIGNIESFEILGAVCEEMNNETGVKCGLGIDIAGSSLWDEKQNAYVYKRKDKKLDSGEQLEFVLELIRNYHLIYVEDPFHEEDYKNFAELTNQVQDCLICGDDLFATNEERLSEGMKIGAANAIIIKVNQVGTLTDASETIDLAKGFGCVPVISHRSGDTCDPHIAHLAVALKCPIIKTGIAEGARIAKLNELIRIEEVLGTRARMANFQIL